MTDDSAATPAVPSKPPAGADAAVAKDARAASEAARPLGEGAFSPSNPTPPPSDAQAGDCSTPETGVLRVCGQKIGVSIKYSAVSPGGYSQQKASYLNEVGIKWLRGWNGFEGGATPFDGHTIADVKANPNVLDWAKVGSWAGDSGWYDWAAKNDAIYCPVMWWFQGKLQASTTCDQKAYAFDVTPGSQDENLVWVAVFGMAYWANVVNKYNLVAFDMINEPDNCGGNGGTENTVAGTVRMIELASDALNYVNGTLASPPKPAIIAGPGVLSWWNGKAWIDGALNDTKDVVTKVSFHSYYAEHWWGEIHDGSAYINGLTGGAKKQWITEWGQWWYADGYGTQAVVRGMGTVLPQLGLWNIELASPWELTQSNGLQNGLVRSDGSKTELYWLTKMYNRALLSEKNMLATSSANQEGDPTFAWATQDATDLYVIYENLGTAALPLTIDLGAVPAADGKAVDVFRVGPGTSSGEVVDLKTTVSGGKVALQATADTYYVLKINGAGYGS
jgi:hypothetical protein